MDGATWLPAPREKSRARAEIADASYLIVAERPLQICRVPAGEKFRIGAQVTYTGPLTGFPADIDVELLRSMADIYATKIGFVPLTQKLDSEYCMCTYTHSALLQFCLIVNSQRRMGDNQPYY
jgi:hypothetical protein